MKRKTKKPLGAVAGVMQDRVIRCLDPFRQPRQSQTSPTTRQRGQICARLFLLDRIALKHRNMS
jgi:hypothetical protein